MRSWPVQYAYLVKQHHNRAEQKKGQKFEEGREQTQFLSACKRPSRTVN